MPLLKMCEQPVLKRLNFGVYSGNFNPRWKFNTSSRT